MVFSVSPKHVPRARAAQENALFSDLPDELLLQILDDVETGAILKLREVARDFVPACNTAIQRRLKTLYIHPKSTSLLSAVKICNRSVFSQHIEKVVILGKVLWFEIGNSYPEIRNIRGEEKTERRQCKGWNSRFRAWPEEFPKLQACNTQDDDDARKPPTHFAVAYESLLAALRGLPKLRKLAFAESVQAPGYNRTSKAAIDGHAHKTSQSLHPQRRLADAHVLSGILFDPRLQFEELTLNCELPFIKNMLSQFEGEPKSNPNVFRAVGALVSLELNIDCGWQVGDCHMLYRRLLEYSSPSLQHLKITLTPNIALKDAKISRIFEVVLHNFTFPQLTSLALELLKQPPPTIPQGKIAARYKPPKYYENRPQRPTCHRYGISSFLSRHPVLEDIRFHNIIFCEYDSKKTGKSHETVKDILKVLKAREKLEKFEWIINRYVHDPRCKAQLDTDPTVDCSKFHCGVYSRIELQSSWVSDFDKLWTKLTGEHETDRKAWEFGQKVLGNVEVVEGELQRVES